jgi:hypothetical protein
MQGPAEENFSRISTRSSHKDLHEIMQGHLEYFARTSSRFSHKNLHKIMHLEDFTRISTRSEL